MESGSRQMSDRRRTRKECLPPWAGYHRALKDAQHARGRLLRNILSALGTSLKDRIGYQARK